MKDKPDPMAEDIIQHVRNEVEYILDDDTVGEVRVTYGDGRSEIKQARVLLVDDIMRVVEGAYNAYTTNKIIEELEELKVIVSSEGAGKIYRGTLSDGSAVTLEDRIAELRRKL